MGCGCVGVGMRVGAEEGMEMGVCCMGVRGCDDEALMMLGREGRRKERRVDSVSQGKESFEREEGREASGREGGSRMSRGGVGRATREVVWMSIDWMAAGRAWRGVGGGVWKGVWEDRCSWV